MSNISVEANLTPGLFIELANPSWARVHIELSFGRDYSKNRLAWSSDVVRKEYISLTGFDPARVQYANLEAQHAALNSARELECALFEADEKQELDGRQALDFANGWMSCCAWVAGADQSTPPNEDAIRSGALRCLAASGVFNRDEFVAGFTKRAQLGFSFVA